jgi:Tfp pilus assembly protein PilO
MNTLYSQSFRNQLAVALLLMCLELSAGYSIDLRRLRHQYIQIQQSHRVAIKTITTAERQITDYQALQTQLANWKRNFNQALQPLRQPATLANLLQQLSTQAEYQGLKLQAILPLKPRISGIFTIQPLQLNILANYAALVQFITQLSQLPLFLKVTHFAVIANKDGALPQANLTIEIYQYAPASNKTTAANLPALLKKLTPLPPSAAVSETKTLPGRDLFSATTPLKNQRNCNTQQLLTCFPLNDYHVLGIIQQNQHFWAIVLDPQGNLHQVTQGMYLSTQQSRITHIDTYAITVINNNSQTATLVVEK